MKKHYKIIITSPSLDPNKNVSGVSAVTNFIIKNNPEYNYHHFQIGKTDNEKRDVFRIFRILGSWFQWFNLIIRNRKALIHFNFALEMRSIIRDLPLILYTQILGRKLVIHLHGGEYLEKKAPAWLGFFLKRAFSGNNPKIVLSNHEQELLTRKFNAKNVTVLPNSIDLKDAAEFNRNSFSKSPLNLLFIGRIDRNKGLEYIYEALSILKKKNIRFNFFMAGVGPEKEEYLQKFTHSLNSYFEYKGVVSGEAKNQLFKDSDIFLLPSLYEGLPISLLESMSYGIVPVVTNVGSIGTLVKNEVTGMMVKKQSAEDIANKIEQLISNRDLRQKMGKNARQLIFKDFDPALYIEKLNKIYGEVMD